MSLFSKTLFQNFIPKFYFMFKEKILILATAIREILCFHCCAVEPSALRDSSTGKSTPLDLSDSENPSSQLSDSENPSSQLSDSEKPPSQLSDSEKPSPPLELPHSENLEVSSSIKIQPVYESTEADWIQI